jgi:hypothetical protein
MTFLEKQNCFWTLINSVSTLNIKEIINPEYKFTYILNYNLISNHEFKKIDLRNGFINDSLFSNCYTNILMESNKIRFEDLDFLAKKPINLLQTNSLLPEYLNYNEMKLELFLNLINKKTDWKYYIELSAYNRDTEI